MNRRLIGLVLAAAVTCSAGCAHGTAPASPAAPTPAPTEVTAKKQDSINVPWFPEDSLNPYSCETLQNYYLAGLLCDPLVALGADQTPQNRLALELTPDHNTYIIPLRHDALFSDGTPLTAEDVLYSLELARASPRFSAGLAGVEKAEAADSGTVRITLTAPDVFFPRALTFPIIKKDTAELAIPIGVGRFTPRTEQKLLVRNAAYYNPVKHINQIALCSTNSLEEQSFAIMEGKIDFMYSDLQGDLNLGLGIGYRQIPLSNMVYLGVNGSGACASQAVRSALSGLIDRDELARKVYMGFASSTSLPISPSAAVTTLSASDLEVNKDKQHLTLTQAGYTPEAPLVLELLVNGESDERGSAAELITKMYKDSGIALTVTVLPFAQYSERIAKGEYDLYLGEVRLPYNMDLSALIFPGGALNPAAPSLPALAALYAEVRGGKSPPELLEERLRSELPIIPLLFRRGILCFSRDFSANIVATEQDIFYNIVDW